MALLSPWAGGSSVRGPLSAGTVPGGTLPLCRQTGTSLPRSLLGAAESGWAGAWMGLGAAGTARAGDASPSVEPSSREGCKGAGGVPAVLTLTEGFPWVVDVKPLVRGVILAAPCCFSPSVCTFLAPCLALLHETLGKA